MLLVAKRSEDKPNGDVANLFRGWVPWLGLMQRCVDLFRINQAHDVTGLFEVYTN
jgi:hypothetical protein